MITRTLDAQRPNIELLQALILRELRSRYRGSYLGWLWAVARPLVMLLIYGLIVGVFLGAARSIPDFMIFIFIGLVAWNLFSTIVTGAIASVISNGPLLSKNRFPRILLPLASITVALIDTVIQLFVLIFGYMIVGEWPALAGLHFVFPAFLGVVLFGLGLGLILAALNVYIRDIGYLTEVALQVGFWLCPILYTYTFVIEAAESYGVSTEFASRIFLLNPMANIVIGFQQALWPPSSIPEFAAKISPGNLDLRLWLLVVLGIGFLALGTLIFNRLARNFAQELG